MSFVQIGAARRDLASVDPQWITQQINGLIRDGKPVCIVVDIQERDVHVRFQTADCGGSGGGQWNPNRKEQVVYELWKKTHVDEKPVHPGNVVAFVEQLKRAI